MFTGTPSVFVRTSGCNLRCGFCDTPYTSWEPEGEDFSVDEILQHVDSLLAIGEPCSHVVLTGGEPMLFAELVPLASALRRRGLHITVETAGTLYLPLACDLMSISPKLGNSTPSESRDPHWHERHERSRHVPEVIRQLVKDYEYQIKFVIDSLQDCQEVETWLGEFPEIRRARVQLMPQGVDRQALRSWASGSNRTAASTNCNSARAGTSSGSATCGELEGKAEFGRRNQDLAGSGAGAGAAGFDSGAA